MVFFKTDKYFMMLSNSGKNHIIEGKTFYDSFFLYLAHNCLLTCKKISFKNQKTNLVYRFTETLKIFSETTIPKDFMEDPPHSVPF